VSDYPITGRDRRVPPAALRANVASIFEACGMEQGDAALVADSLVAADLRAVHSHGVLRVPDYVAKLAAGGVNPRGRPFVARETGAIAVIDGDNAMGQIAASAAIDEAMARARRHGVGVAAVRGSNHCGAMFYYTLPPIEAGMIGIATTNALPTMAPWGGKDKIVGINPLAVGIPAGERHPILLDAAFSYSSHGKVRVYHQKGAPIPPTWAFDVDGHPTTDPAKALEGLLQPIGEYKGVGLAVVCGMLSSLLSGAAYGTELGNMVDGPRPGQDGHFLMALRIDAFEDLARFRARVDAVITQIEEGRRVDPGKPIYAPGGLEAAKAEEYQRDGIPLTEATIAGLWETAAPLGVKALDV
jgi:LDH2 family malate/lactate/ureidoglycolate dehydrogenase